MRQVKTVHIKDTMPVRSGGQRFRSPLRYPGGKQKAVDQIAAMLPASVYEYREPMVGGASIFFHARSISLAQKYWINDKFFDLAAFWRTVGNQPECTRLIRELEELRRSFKTPSEIRRYFLQARQEEPSTDYRRALLFFFFNRVTFSGTTRAGGFSSAASLRRFTASSIERLAPMPQALADVRITNDDYECLVQAPGKDVFLFLDPPYFQATRLYGRNGDLHEFDHERLAALLRNSPHRFLITYDDCPQIRALYRWAKVSKWHLQYGMNNCNRKHTTKIGSELFIRNY